ncbi:MAG: hypothetical protein VX589_21405 [Myxococcota bacterium]|nr:hypothetical protein [Myxococcota bacterium]
MYRVEWTFEPTNLGALMAAAEQGIKRWKDAGCMEVSLWAPDGSAAGQFAFGVTCASAEQFYQIEDAMQTNPEFMAWQMAWQKMFVFTGNYRVTPVMDLSTAQIPQPGFMAQWHFVPDDMEIMMAAAKEGAEIWGRHGAKMIMLTSLAGTGVGQFSFVIACESGAEYGAILDKLTKDDAFMH